LKKRKNLSFLGKNFGFEIDSTLDFFTCCIFKNVSAGFGNC
jgi:hypothetical protein